MSDFEETPELGQDEIDEAVVRRHWGSEYPAMVEVARLTVENISEQDLVGLEEEVGTERFLRGAAAIGRYLIDRRLSGADAVAAIRAHAKIEDLKLDSTFVGRYLSRDRVTAEGAAREMQLLCELAYPAALDEP